jgi:hypothetical protein
MMEGEVDGLEEEIVDIIAFFGGEASMDFVADL